MAPSGPRRPDTVYDVHAHCVPESMITALSGDNPFGVVFEESPAGTVAVLSGGLRVPVGMDLVDLDRRLTVMAAQGVDVQVISPFMDLAGYHLSESAAASWARLYNDSLAEEVARSPDRFEAMATVPLQDGQAAASELDRAVSDLGMVGVEVGSRAGDTNLDDPDLEPFWERAAALRAIVLLHPVDPLAGLDLRQYGLAHVVGRPAETTIAAARLLLSGVLERHDGLRVVVVHGGGFLPFQVGRIVKGQPASNGRSARPDPATMMEAFGRLFHDTVLSDERALFALVHMVGAEQVVLGSDFPYLLGDPDPVRSVEAAGLPAAAQRAIISENLAGLVAGVRRASP